MIASFFAGPWARHGELSVAHFFPWPRPDLREHILAQDVVVVAGGNTANMLAIWRVHGFDAILREAWEAGVVLTGASAGMICWFEAGVTDSFGPQLEGMRRRPRLPARQRVPALRRRGARAAPATASSSRRAFPPASRPTTASALHYVGTELEQVVACRPDAAAYRVTAAGEEPLRGDACSRAAVAPDQHADGQHIEREHDEDAPDRAVRLLERRDPEPERQHPGRAQARAQQRGGHQQQRRVVQPADRREDDRDQIVSASASRSSTSVPAPSRHRGRRRRASASAVAASRLGRARQPDRGAEGAQRVPAIPEARLVVQEPRVADEPGEADGRPRDEREARPARRRASG